MNLFTLVKGRFIIERAIFNKIEEWIGWSDTVCRWDSKVFEEERISDDEGFEEGGGNVREGGGGREGEGEFGRDDDGDEGRILRRFKRGKFIFEGGEGGEGGTHRREFTWFVKRSAEGWVFIMCFIRD